MTDAGYVVCLDQVESELGDSYQAKYILNYLRNSAINAKTAVIENNYVDRDFTIDFSRYYARSFGKKTKCSKRIHFFSNQFGQGEFDGVLEGKRPDILKEIIDSYLGFTIVKPFNDHFGNPLVGRTLMPIMPRADGKYTRLYLCSKYPISLYGIPLCAKSFPFQAQDGAVSACATMSLWILNNKLNKIFHTPLLSPIEITERATHSVEENRGIPSSGLTLKQMLTFFKSIDIDYEYINLDYINSVFLSDAFSKETKRKSGIKLKRIIPDTMKAVLTANIPIIAVLCLRAYDGEAKLKCEDLHAVVLTGYKYDSDGNIISIYIHDDQIGPFSRVKDKSGNGSFLSWSNEWIEKFGYSDITVNGLLIPYYPKIRLNYQILYDTYLSLLEEQPDKTFYMYLTNVQNYKNALLSLDLKDKTNILKRSMPRFLWVISAIKGQNIIWDQLYDATSHKVEPLKRIDFINTN
jgi:hypothetical protein